MDFTLNRNLVFASRMGHSVDFKKGVPTHVPPALYSEVMAIGAISSEEIIAEEPTIPTAPSDPIIRDKDITDAMKKIVERGARTDFTAAGKPHVDALRAIIGYDIGATERDNAWQKYLDAKRESEAE